MPKGKGVHMGFGGSSGGSTSVAGSSDVALSSPINNDVLSYDSTSSKWKNATTVTQAAMNLKAPLASPVLTGTPTAPTPTAGTNTTQLATTAFVATSNAGKATAVTANAKLWIGTQAQYDAIVSKDATTLYAVTA